MTIGKKKSSKHLVQVSTYIPYAMKMQLLALAESQEQSSYALLRSVIEDFISKAELKGLVMPTIAFPQEPDKSTDEELLG